MNTNERNADDFRRALSTATRVVESALVEYRDEIKTLNSAEAALDADNQRMLQDPAFREEVKRDAAALRESVQLPPAYANLRDIQFDIQDENGYGPGVTLPPPWYILNVKRGEVLPVYVNETSLRYIRDRHRILCANNEFALAGIECRANYIVGEKGLSYVAKPTTPDSPKAKELAKKTQQFIDLFCEVNAMPDRESDTIKKLDIEGEAFHRLFVDADTGMPLVRSVQPEHVTSPTGDTWMPSRSFGIETPAQDVETIRGYWIVENPLDSWQPTFVDERFIVHQKLNVDRTAKRGLPSYYPVERNLKRCEDLLSSMTSMARARAKIALIRKLEGVTSQTANTLLSSLIKFTSTDPVTGEPNNIEQMRPGTIITAGANTTYEMPSTNVAASDFVEVLQAELRAVASRMQMSEWMFTALADAKYSNAFAVEAPTLKAFKKIQGMLCRSMGSNRAGSQRSLLWRAINLAVQTGLLPRDVLTEVRIQTEGPSLEARDKSAEANANRTYNEMGVKSTETIQQELTLDPKQEQENFKRERAASVVAKAAESSQQVVAIQTAFYGGQLPRMAAGAALQLLLGVDAETAAKLLPLEHGVSRVAEPPQPPGMPGMEGPPPGPDGGTPVDPSADPSAGPSAPPDQPSTPEDAFGDALMSALGSGTESGPVQEATAKPKKNGVVVDKKGRKFYYVNGKKVKNPNLYQKAKMSFHKSAPQRALSGAGHVAKHAASYTALGGVKFAQSVGSAVARAAAHIRKNPISAIESPPVARAIQHVVRALAGGYNRTPQGKKVLATAPTWASKIADKHAAGFAKQWKVTPQQAHQSIQKLVIQAAKDAAKHGEMSTQIGNKTYTFKHKPGLARQFRDAFDGGFAPGQLRIREALREAGFTGEVVAKNGAKYWYQDGKRVKHPHTVASGTATAHAAHHDDKVKGAHKNLAAKIASKVFQRPEDVTTDELTHLADVLSKLPPSAVAAFHDVFKQKMESKLNAEAVAAVDAVLPAPAAPEPTVDTAGGQSTEPESGPVTSTPAVSSAPEPVPFTAPVQSKIDDFLAQLAKYQKNKKNFPETAMYLKKFGDSLSAEEKDEIHKVLGVNLDDVDDTKGKIKGLYQKFLLGKGKLKDTATAANILARYAKGVLPKVAVPAAVAAANDAGGNVSVEDNPFTNAPQLPKWGAAETAVLDELEANIAAGKYGSIGEYQDDFNKLKDKHNVSTTITNPDEYLSSVDALKHVAKKLGKNSFVDVADGFKETGYKKADAKVQSELEANLARGKYKSVSELLKGFHDLKNTHGALSSNEGGKSIADVLDAYAKKNGTTSDAIMAALGIAASQAKSTATIDDFVPSYAPPEDNEPTPAPSAPTATTSQPDEVTKHLDAIVTAFKQNGIESNDELEEAFANANHPGVNEDSLAAHLGFPSAKEMFNAMGSPAWDNTVKSFKTSADKAAEAQAASSAATAPQSTTVTLKSNPDGYKPKTFDPSAAPVVDYAGKKAAEIDGWKEMESIPHGKRAYGAVVLRKDPATGKTQVLLREPTNHFDGYHWTFPKGKQDNAGDTPHDVAHKELAEETGYGGKIIGHIPKTFGSQGVTKNAFFIMQHDGGAQDKSKMDAETADTKWIDVDKAHELIGLTTKASGKARDLAILDAVKAHIATPQDDKLSAHANKLEELIQSAKDNNRTPDEISTKVNAEIGDLSPEAHAELAKMLGADDGDLVAHINNEIENHKLGGGFPSTLKKVEVLDANIGGSTGAKKVSVKGNEFAMKSKSGADAGHVENEHLADTLYSIIGAGVPKVKLYKEGDKSTKLSQWVGGTPLNELKGAARDAAHAELKKHFVADALLGNWDVIGESADNVKVDANGKVYRIDNGGALEYRAQGKKKTAADFGNDVVELNTMLDANKNPQAAKVFGGITQDEMKAQAKDLLTKKSQILAAIPDTALRSKMEARMNSLSKRFKLNPHTLTAHYNHSNPKATLEIFPQFTPPYGYSSFSAESGPEQVEYLNHINKDAYEGVRSYTNGGYGSFNEAMRMHAKDPVKYPLSAEYQKKRERLDKAFAAQPDFKTPITVWRGTSMTPTQLAKFVDFAERKAKSGKPVKWNQEQSTGSIPAKSWGGNAQFVITNVKKGLDVNPISSNPGESEILLQRGTHYKITKVENKGGKYTFHMEQYHESE